MDENFVHDANDIAKVVDSTTSFLGVIRGLFPGVQIGSRARGEAKATKRAMKCIESTKKWAEGIGLSDESVSDLCDDIYRRATGRERLESVVEFAFESGAGGAECHVLEQSWVELFREGAERACNEEAQRLWGRVLAGEMECPGSFSKRAMSALMLMSAEEAEALQKLARFTVRDCVLEEGRLGKLGAHLVLKRDGGGTYNDGEIVGRDLFMLSSAGLLEVGVGWELPWREGMERLFLASGERIVASNGGSSRTVCVSFEEASLTPLGAELVTLCDLGTSPALAGWVKTKLQLSGLSVSTCSKMEGMADVSSPAS